MLITKLNRLREISGYSYQDISEKTKISLSTVKRIFAGESSNPYYRNVADIVIFLNGSLDNIEGIKTDKAIEVPELPELLALSNPLETSEDVINPPENPEIPADATCEQIIELYERALELSHEALVSEQRAHAESKQQLAQQLAQKDGYVRLLIKVTLVIMAIAGLFFAYDMFHDDIGYFRSIFSQ